VLAAISHLQYKREGRSLHRRGNKNASGEYFGRLGRIKNMRKSGRNPERSNRDRDVAVATSPSMWGSLYAYRGLPLFRVLSALTGDAPQAMRDALRAVAGQDDPKKLN
jgi:hypothetical protein